MKKILLPGIICLLSINTFAQQLRLSAISIYDNQSGLLDTSSLQYNGSRATDYTRDMRGYGADTISWYYPVNGQLQPDGKSLNFFDNSGRPALYLEINFPGGGNDTSLKEDYTYDNNSNLTTRVTSQYYAPGLLSAGSKVVNTYNGANLVEQVLGQAWDSTLTSWVNTNLTVFTYVGSQVDTQVSAVWGGTGWIPQSRTIYHYNSLQQVDSVLGQSSYTQTLSWTDDVLYTYHYDANGNLDALTQFAPSPMWTYSLLTNYTYDNNHNNLTTIRQTYDGTEFVNADRDTYTYNSANLVTTDLVENWDNVNNIYYDYHTIYNRYYEQIPTGVAYLGNSNNLLTVYPNPAANTLNIKTEIGNGAVAGITIFDTKGTAVKHWYVSGSDNYTGTTNISDLPQGNYMLRNDNTQAIQKFTIVR